MRRERRRAYILVLPSLFTTGNLFCGFYSILRSFQHDFERAAYAILLAGIFDALDGRVARMTRSQSKFGFEYDSIADVASFGLAPAILVYIWVLEGFGRLGFAAAFFFVACGALRLARFNTISDELPKSYFIGLPIPAAANVIATAAILLDHVKFILPNEVFLPVVFGLGLMMVSNVRYRSFKDFDVGHRRQFFQLVLIVMIGALAVVKWEAALLTLFASYAIWGPAREGLGIVKRYFRRKEAPSTQPIPAVPLGASTDVEEPAGGKR